ncbi:MAG: hypothetical protein GX153_02265 [Clostridiaceae bacterium]|nr:hypothetical protein [Clostridiaceae bacterium]
MPFVHLQLSRPLEPAVKKELASAVGGLISILPNKSERGLMLRIEDDCGMFFRGAEADCVYVDVRLYLASPFDKKGEFARALLETIQRITGTEPGSVYMSFAEYGNWVSGGDIK